MVPPRRSCGLFITLCLAVIQILLAWYGLVGKLLMVRTYTEGRRGRPFLVFVDKAEAGNNYSMTGLLHL